MVDHFRFAIRRLVRNPVPAVLSIAALGFAIGAGSVIFSAVEAVMLRPFGFAHADRLVSLWSTDARQPGTPVEISFGDFKDWQRRNNGGALESAALISSVNLDYTLTGLGEPAPVEGTLVSPEFFQTVGSGAALGRVFTRADDKENAPYIVVISHRLWQSRFGSDPNILGRTLRLDDQLCSISGVMPASFDYPRGVDLWAPLFTAGQADDPASEAIRMFTAVGRLAPGVTVEGARVRLAAVARQLAETRSAGSATFGIQVEPLEQAMLGSARNALPLLLGAVLGVVLIACINVVHLRLADALSRRREMAVRAALGASAGQTLGQLLAESAVIAAAGGLLGAAIAQFGVDVLVALAPRDIPRIENAAVSGPVVAFIAALVVAATLITGLLPAWVARGAGVQTVLADGGGGSGRGSAGRGRARLRDALMAAQVAMAAALLIGGGLLLDSFRRLGNLNPGFSAPRVLTFRVTLPRPRYNAQEKRKAFYDAVLTRLHALPGVESAAAVLLRPLSGAVGWDFSFSMEGQSLAEAAANAASNFETISPGYFSTMGIPLVAGRDFTAADRTGTAPVAIINESAARRYFPGGSAVGRRVKFGKPGSSSTWMEIVGVVKDVRYREWEATRTDIYVPVMQNAQHRSDFVVKARQQDVLRLAPQIRAAVLAVDKDQPASSLTTVDGLVSAALARPRFNAALLGVFAACALLLAMVGIFGVVSHGVGQRTSEIGIRMALGAQRSQVLAMIVGRGALVSALGIALGAGLALAGGRAIGSLLYGITSWHPAIYGGAAAIVLALSCLACLWPAFRASRVDPVSALRQ